MSYNYNKDEIKKSLTIDQIMDFLTELGGEPFQQKEDIIVSKTICHGGESHKLYYYDNTKLFRCYTDCGGEAFDIFELTTKVKSREEPKISFDENNKPAFRAWTLFEAVSFVAQFFNIIPNYSNESFENENVLKDDWELFNNYDRINSISIEKKKVELKTYDGTFLKNLPRPKIIPWLQEGITQEVMDKANICFDPKNYGIVIPHYDINNRLIGIRERTLVKENEIYGKYRPAYIHQKLYNHPLSFNLYNLNNSKNNIKIMKKAFVFEGEKSCLLYRSYFGFNNDISVACCGSSFIQYQAELLIDLGVEEIIIGFDKQFQETGDKEFEKLTRNLTNINKKYGKYVNISFLFDKWNYLDYKDSPIDKGKNIFLELFKRRIFI